MSQIPYTVRKVTILTVVFCFCLFVCGVEALASLNGISDISKLDCLSPGQWECRSGRCSEPGLRFSLNSGSGWEQVPEAIGQPAPERALLGNQANLPPLLLLPGG